MEVRRLFLNTLLLCIFLLSSSFLLIKKDEGKHNTNLITDTVSTNLNEKRIDSPNNYLWPTDAGRKITSTFAEYRLRHFHAGIDISTNNQLGYKVFAPADGYVYRIRITPNGYGKMLYLKHYDGYITTYAHLQSFNDVISEVVKNEQYKLKKFAIDLVFDSPVIDVKKGEVIAYTGDTGFGPPHLHFELRDENLNPINPMLFKSFNCNDNIPPRIKRIVMLPLEYNSTINGDNCPKFFSCYNKNGRYIINQNVFIHGKIGIGIEAIDFSEEAVAKTGIYSVELFLEDSLIYRMKLDSIPIDKTKLIQLHYDLTLLKQGIGKFQKLFVDMGNSLPLYDNKTVGAGIINTELLPEGKHQYKIICKDIFNNKAELNGSFFFNRKPAIKLLSTELNNILVTSNDNNSIKKFYLSGKLKTSNNWLLHTLTKDRFDVNNSTIKLPINLENYEIIKIIAENKFGVKSLPIFYADNCVKNDNSDINIEHKLYNDYLLVSIFTSTFFTSPPVCTLIEDTSERRVNIEAVDFNKYVGAIVPLNEYVNRRFIKVDATIKGKFNTKTKEVKFYTIPTNKSGSFKVENGNLQISYDSGAVFKPLYLRINRDSSLPYINYQLEPSDVLLDKGIVVSIPIPSNADSTIGLYTKTNGSWVFQTCKADSTGRFFSTSFTNTVGEIAILKDDIPPTIGKLHISTSDKKPYVSFRYNDNLSGVNLDELTFLVDNEFVIPEIDGEHHRIWYKAEKQASKGKHKVKIVIKDKIGNKQEVNRIYYIN